MKIAIIALLISLAALGLGGFATVRTFNESHPEPLPPAAQWSEAECETARDSLVDRGTLWRGCVTGGSCDAYNDMLQAIAENCP